MPCPAPPTLPPDFENDPRFQPRVLSPGAQARQTLREEQVGVVEPFNSFSID